MGTFDGFWAFEMERRGAGSVVAIDVDDPAALDWRYDERRRGPDLVRAWGAQRGPGFATAAAALGSGVERLGCSVYDLDPELHGRFDVALCGSLLLHLRDPVRALERIREVVDGELVLVEPVDPLLDLVAGRAPSAAFAPTVDMWWRANSAGLTRMLEIAGFRVTWVGRRFLTPFGGGVTHRVRPGLHGLAAGRPWRSGMLTRALRAVPRSPQGG